MPRRVGRPARRGRLAPARRRARRPRHPRVLRRDRPRDVPRSTTSTSPTTSSSATGSVHVQTHHGTPLKHMGLDLQRVRDAGAAGWTSTSCSGGSPAGTTASAPTRTPPRSGSACTRARTRRSRSATRATTCSPTPRRRTSPRVRAALGIAPGQTAVLYAPTHREYEEGYVPRLDLARLVDGARAGPRRPRAAALLL